MLDTVRAEILLLCDAPSTCLQGQKLGTLSQCLGAALSGTGLHLHLPRYALGHGLLQHGHMYHTYHEQLVHQEQRSHATARLHTNK